MNGPSRDILSHASPMQPPDTAAGVVQGDFDGLIDLYYERYKLLYSKVQTFNEMPVELVFEIAAAWDHLSRHWKYREPLSDCISQAVRHVKRATLDAFKLIVKARIDQYHELRRVDTSLIDNGDFDRRLHALIAEIREIATHARQIEGSASALGHWETVFGEWEKADEKCEEFYRGFYLSPKVAWARQKTRNFAWRSRIEGFTIGVLASVAASLIWWFVSR